MGEKLPLPVRTGMMLAGILLIGVSVALYRLAAFGVDPFTGMNLGISTFLGWSFGNWQLLANALWPGLFFGLGLYWGAAAWLAMLLALVLWTWSRFKRLDDLAGILMIPYALWCAFALYLNIGIAVLNT